MELKRLAEFSFAVWCFVAMADYITTVYGVFFLGFSESNLLGFPVCLTLASVVAVASLVLFKVSGRISLEDRSLLFVSIWIFFIVVATIQVGAVINNFRLILVRT